MKFIERFRLWRTARAERKHNEWLKTSRTMMRLPKPDPRTVVHNSRRPL